MEALTVFYDANVLYPAELRSFLMHLALTGLFSARWSNQVHEEWIGNLLNKRPDLTRQQLERTRDLMNKHALGCLVTGYESLISGLHLPDENDRHVLAAAIHGRANVIVTANLKDFPGNELSRFGIEAQHPDKFILSLVRKSPEEVIQAAQDHRLSLKNPSKTEIEYLDTLERQGLPRTASVLRKYLSVE